MLRKLRQASRFYSAFKTRPDSLYPAAVEIYEDPTQKVKLPLVEGMYTPMAEPTTGFINGLPAGMHWPELESSRMTTLKWNKRIGDLADGRNGYVNSTSEAFLY